MDYIFPTRLYPSESRRVWADASFRAGCFTRELVLTDLGTLKISRKTLRFYGIWALVGIGILALVFLNLLALEWRPVYQYQKWYREHPAPEETLIGRIVRNPLGEEWIRLFAFENGTVKMVDRDAELPPDATVIYREYSYRLVLSDGESIDIYGAGADVRQVRLLSGLQVQIKGKRVWFEVNGVNMKEELWPKRLRIYNPDR